MQHETEAQKERRLERIRNAMKARREEDREDLFTAFCEAPDNVCSCCHRTWYKKSGTQPQEGQAVRASHSVQYPGHPSL